MPAPEPLEVIMPLGRTTLNTLQPSHGHRAFEDLDRLASFDEPQVAAESVLEFGNAHLFHDLARTA